jgi:hypothetical protein
MDKVNKDDLVAFLHFGKVVEVIGPHNVVVEDVDRGSRFKVQGDSLIKAGFSADEFTTTKRVSMTEAAQLLIDAKNRPLSVCFTKADGEKRTLRGRLVSPEPLLGRSMVEDLDISRGHRLRQVDHRTIEWLIVDGKKYVVKTK